MRFKRVISASSELKTSTNTNSKLSIDLPFVFDHIESDMEFTSIQSIKDQQMGVSLLHKSRAVIFLTDSRFSWKLRELIEDIRYLWKRIARKSLPLILIDLNPEAELIAMQNMVDTLMDLANIDLTDNIKYIHLNLSHFNNLPNVIERIKHRREMRKFTSAIWWAISHIFQNPNFYPKELLKYRMCHVCLDYDAELFYNDGFLKCDQCIEKKVNSNRLETYFRFIS